MIAPNIYPHGGGTAVYRDFPKTVLCGTKQDKGLAFIERGAGRAISSDSCG